MIRLALGIPCWQDGREMIEQTIRSLDGRQDLLLLADGAIDGVDQQGIPDLSDLGWLEPGEAIVSQRRWPSQSAKRDWLLQTARAHGADWLIQLDSDERLHHADTLKLWLDCWLGGAFPLPFEHDRERWPGTLIGASWKCIRVQTWRRVTLQGAYLEHMLDGRIYCLVPPEGRLDGFVDGLPYVSHHPEERPEGRRQIRLSELEDRLEPSIDLSWEPYPTPWFEARPAHAGRAGFFCDQCGRRYRTPGVCAVQHPRTIVQPLEQVVAA